MQIQKNVHCLQPAVKEKAVTNWRQTELFLPHIENELRNNMTLRANSSPLMAIESDLLIAPGF